MRNQTVFISPETTMEMLEEKLARAYGVIRESKDMNSICANFAVPSLCITVRCEVENLSISFNSTTFRSCQFVVLPKRPIITSSWTRTKRKSSTGSSRRRPKNRIRKSQKPRRLQCWKVYPPRRPSRLHPPSQKHIKRLNSLATQIHITNPTLVTTWPNILLIIFDDVVTSTLTLWASKMLIRPPSIRRISDESADPIASCSRMRFAKKSTQSRNDIRPLVKFFP